MSDRYIYIDVWSVRIPQVRPLTETEAMYIFGGFAAESPAAADTLCCVLRVREYYHPAAVLLQHGPAADSATR